MTYIKLKDSIFEVRRIAGEQQIKVDNRWMGHLDFLHYLIDNSKVSELGELADLGYNLLNEKDVL